ncbi:AAA-ATPase At3g50940 [Ziziphus jujuba]|uniref:AAA-ATPase At3g50940 n=1 Tax=Ziziphus jujuba TaxID=326968 RepID=A0A6P4A8E5_ZIZJJ|nr:AAA-ATPase At3g50940 [Ziziphus jujuba]
MYKYTHLEIETHIHSEVKTIQNHQMASSSSSPDNKLAMAKTILATAASIATTVMVARSVAQDLLPHEFHDFLFSGIRNFFNRFSSQLTMVIEEFDGLVNNQIYEAAETYLGSKVSPSTHRLKVSKPENEKSFIITMESNEEITDVFNGVKFNWVLVTRQVETKNFYNPRDLNSTLRSEVRSLELSFHKKNRDLVLNTYLPHILEEYKSIKQEKKTIKIFTVEYENLYCNLADAWIPTNLDHPANFETLALDSEIKDFILGDLERFLRRKEYYRKIGKAWKRGYLLYGPPGTGKSSLIAAMANYLNFDIYDLELTEIRSNSELRRLLIAMANRSILVVEDIDCTVEFQDRVNHESGPSNVHNSEDKKVTLSGMLNFIDGLWSSCGDERIIVFTTNHKEKLDPALLRPGRMDVHVHMSYCTPCGFKLLASNYLGIENHMLFEEIEQQLQITQVTPAEVAEQLIKTHTPDEAVQGLIEFMKTKKKEKEEANAKKEQEADKKLEAKDGKTNSDEKVKEVDNDDKK